MQQVTKQREGREDKSSKHFHKVAERVVTSGWLYLKSFNLLEDTESDKLPWYH